MNKHALIFSAVLLMSLSEGALALDSYRYLHVTIDTPWLIFSVPAPDRAGAAYCHGDTLLVFRHAQAEESR